MVSIKIKRVYDPVSKGDGVRILVDRLWPRGIKKDAGVVKHWIKDVAPSSELRKWFSHDPERWGEFQKRYYAELEHCPEAIGALIQTLRKGTVTFLYSAKNTEHNNAVCLKKYLERKHTV